MFRYARRPRCRGPVRACEQWGHRGPSAPRSVVTVGARTADGAGVTSRARLSRRPLQVGGLLLATVALGTVTAPAASAMVDPTAPADQAPEQAPAAAPRVLTSSPVSYLGTTEKPVDFGMGKLQIHVAPEPGVEVPAGTDLSGAVVEVTVAGGDGPTVLSCTTDATGLCAFDDSGVWTPKDSPASCASTPPTRSPCSRSSRRPPSASTSRRARTTPSTATAPTSTCCPPTSRTSCGSCRRPHRPPGHRGTCPAPSARSSSTTRWRRCPVASRPTRRPPRAPRPRTPPRRPPPPSRSPRPRDPRPPPRRPWPPPLRRRPGRAGRRRAAGRRRRRGRRRSSPGRPLTACSPGRAGRPIR